MRLGLVVVVVSLVGALSGCSPRSGGAPHLTSDQYKEQVNRICADAANLTSAIAPPKLEATGDEIGTYAQELRSILGPHVRAIEEIPVPPALRSDMLQINDLFNALLRSLADQVAAGRVEDGERILAASKRITSLQNQLNTKANGIGLFSCSSGP
jgi:hypothetical protein